MGIRDIFSKGRKAKAAHIRNEDAPVFIIGCGRSGTTMLFEMLKSHPQLAPTTGHPDGEDHVGWVEHGQAIISGIYSNAATGDTGHAVGHACCLHMNERDVTDEVRASMHRYYAEDVARGRDDLRVLNKCPHLSNKVGYVHGIFPDARIIHLIRDPVAMVASWINIMGFAPDLALYWPEDEFPCWWVLERKGGMQIDSVSNRVSRLYPGGGLYRFADYWSAINHGILKQAEASGAQVLTIHYERLLTEPEVALREMTDFCEIEPLASVPVAIDTARNSMRKELLTANDVTEIRKRTADVAAMFGYA